MHSGGGGRVGFEYGKGGIGMQVWEGLLGCSSAGSETSMASKVEDTVPS